MEVHTGNAIQSGDVVEFQHSFGYDCKKYFNLCVADETTVLFASGNLIHFLNINTGDIWFRKGVNNGGIGHIVKNPTRPNLAVSETGNNSAITIHEWPSFNIICTLKSNSPKPVLHSRLVFSHDGKLLCSQDGTPDYTLRVWNWQESKIILQKISNKEEVANMLFSPYIPGQFASSGTDHIIFWKIARTFTGVKLVKNIGCFGMMEPTNIIGLLPLEDGKVVSGCQWGNILIWERGIIKLEVLRKNSHICHSAPITYFEFNNGELTSVGMDGKIKIWFFETIDEANPPEDNKIVRIEPIYEFQIGPNENPVQLMSVLKRKPGNSEDSHWVAQDANGGIWKVHLKLGNEAVPSRQCLHSHAGPVVGLAPSPRGNLLASIGNDGRIHVYDFVKKKLLLRRQFPAAGSCIIWFSKNVEPSEKVLLAAFRDGVIRMLQIQSREENLKTVGKSSQFITLIQVIKGHNQPITALTINEEENIVVSGSMDATIFVHLILKKGGLKLVPIGFVQVPSAITFLNWKPCTRKTLLACCQHGEFVEIDLPTKVPLATAVSYEIHNTEKKSFKFDQSNNSSPEPILFATYSDKDTIWLSMGGCFAGYLHEYHFVQGLISKTKIEDAEICSFTFSDKNSFLVLGMNNGHISLNHVDGLDFRNLQLRQTMEMHDQNKGVIRHLCLSSDQCYLFSCGNDGNIFSYFFTSNNLIGTDCKELVEEVMMEVQPIPSVKDIKDSNASSLEEMKIKIDFDQKLQDRTFRVTCVKNKIELYKEAFGDVVNKNLELPSTQKIRIEDFEIDRRITDEWNSIFDREMSDSIAKFAYTLEKSDIGLRKLNGYFLDMLDSNTIAIKAIRNNMKVTNYRQRTLPPEFYKEREMVNAKILVTQNRDEKWSRIKSNDQERRFSVQPLEVFKKHSIPVEPFLMGVDVNVPEYKNNIKLHGIIDRYFIRRKKTQSRDEKLSEMMHVKPDPNENRPEDLAALEAAKHSVGEYELKCVQGYRVKTNSRMTTLSKHSQLMVATESIFKLKKQFNEKLLSLRTKRIGLKERLCKSNMHETFDLRKSNDEEDLRIPIDASSMLLENETEERVFGLKNSFGFDWEVACDDEDQSKDLSECETYMRKFKKINSQFHQEQISRQNMEDVNEFDNEVRCLEEMRVKTDVDLKLLEIFVLQIKQELIILKTFDQREEILLKEYYGLLYERYKTNDRALSVRAEIETFSQLVHSEEMYITELWAKFTLLMKESRHSKKLKRVFKEKFRPPDYDDDWPLSSSDDSSSSDESDGSGKNVEIERRESKLEGFVAQEDLEKKLLDQTLALRTEKYEMQASISEKTKRSECLKREYEKCQKKLETMDNSLEARKSILSAIQNERQQALNNMEVITVINAKQIDGISRRKDIGAISDRVLFSEQALDQIMTRVSDLKQESLLQRQIQKIYRKHLHRLKVECSHMAAKVTSLKRDTAECKKRKFGIDVQVEDLEVALLKSKISDLQSTVSEYKKEQDKRVTELKNNLKSKQLELSKILLENTEKVNLLTTLQKESNFLSQHLLHQAEKQNKIVNNQHSWNLYIFESKRLQTYRLKQLAQITALKKEVQLLGNKSSKRIALPPVLFRTYSQDTPVKGQEKYLLEKYVKEDEYTRDLTAGISQDIYMDPSVETSETDSVSSKDDFIAMISVKGRSKSLEDGMNKF